MGVGWQASDLSPWTTSKSGSRRCASPPSGQDQQDIGSGMIRPLQIGSLTIDWPVILAPMAGYTNAAMRLLTREHHCGLTYTEMVSTEALVRGGTKTLNLLRTLPGERPVGAHLYGCNPEITARAASMIEQLGRFDLIDINCGCPVRKVMSKGAGATLMKDPDGIGRIVAAVKAAVSLPVTVKTRIGFSPDTMNIHDIIQAVTEAGGDAICIHARFATDRHTGAADWEALAQAKSISTIPVIGNGGIETADDAGRMLEQTGVDGVMIARAASGNPWLFDRIYRKFYGETFEELSLTERKMTVLYHLEKLIELESLAIAPKRRRRKHRNRSAELNAVCQFRPHLYRYFSGYRGVTQLGRSLNDLFSFEQTETIIDQLIARNSGKGES